MCGIFLPSESNSSLKFREDPKRAESGKTRRWPGMDAPVRAAGGEPLYFAVDGGVLGVDKNGARLLTGRAVPCATPAAAQAVLLDLRHDA